MVYDIVLPTLFRVFDAAPYPSALLQQRRPPSAAHGSPSWGPAGLCHEGAKTRGFHGDFHVFIHVFNGMFMMTLCFLFEIMIL
jgi:hypothetical protein